MRQEITISLSFWCSVLQGAAVLALCLTMWYWDPVSLHVYQGSSGCGEPSDVALAEDVESVAANTHVDALGGPLGTHSGALIP